MQDFKVIHSKKRDFIVIKSDDKKCRLVSFHKFIYESVNGPVPEGYTIHHIDFDKNNNDISNLIALPKKQHKKFHDCVNYIRGLSGRNIKIKIEGSKNDEKYMELYKKGFRAIKLIINQDKEYILMRDHIGNQFQIPRPLLIKIEFAKIKIEKYSYEELIGMGYKFIKKIRDRETISYLFESPYGNKVCKKECDLFQNKA